MSLLSQTISRKDWVESLKLKSGSHKSSELGKNALTKFDTYINEKLNVEISDNLFDTDDSKLIEELKSKQNKPEFFIFLNGFVQYTITNGLSPRTSRMYFMALKSYLRAQGMKIYNDDVKQFIKFPKIVREIEPPLTREHIRLLLDNATPWMKAFLCGLACNGCRKGEWLFAKVGDIDLNRFPARYHIPAHITKTKEERYTFLTPEAVGSLKPLLNGKEKSDGVFVKPTGRYAIGSLNNRFNDLRKKSGLTNKWGVHSLHVVHPHAFRKFVYTQATLVFDSTYGHKLIGHHEYLDQYDQTTIDQIAEKYKTLIPYLTIYNDEKLSSENELLKAQLESVDNMKVEMEKMKVEMKRLKDLQDEIK